MKRWFTFAPQTRVREQPDAEAAVLAILPVGTELELLQEAGDFYLVRQVDGEGQAVEGYVSKRFLTDKAPLITRSIQKQANEGAQEGGLSAPTDQEVQVSKPAFWPAFDRTSGWLAAGLVLLLVTNLVTTVILYRNVRELQHRSVHVSCSGSRYTPTFVWGKYSNTAVDPHYLQDGQVKAFIEYQVQEKLPGSRIVLRYRLTDEETWRQVNMQEQDKPLLFRATLLTEPTAVIDYQVLQVLNGETVRADDPTRLDLNHFVGTGDVVLHINQQQNNFYELIIYQSPHPYLERLQLERALVEMQMKDKTRVFILTRDQAMRVSFKDEGFTSMNVTITYRDGEERTTLYTNKLQPGVIYTIKR